MKMTPNEKRIQKNMDEGVLTSEGFLGQDRRALTDIIRADEELMQSCGLNYEEVYQKLSDLMQKGREGLGEPMTIDQRWEVQTTESRGVLPCPYEDGVVHKTTAKITKKESGESIYVSNLSLHLFRVHHFHEGRGATYRLDPPVLKRMLYSDCPQESD